MKYSDSLWIEGGVAVDIAGGHLRALDARGNFFGLSCKTSQIAAVSTDLAAVEIILAIPLSKWLLLDPVIGSPVSSRRANRLHLRKTSSGTMLEYFRAEQTAQILLPPDVAVIRDRRGGFLLSSHQPIMAKILLPSTEPEFSPLTFTEPSTDIDSAIHLLASAGLPGGLVDVPGGWLLAAEAGGSHITLESQAWMLEQALKDYPKASPAESANATDDSLEALAESVDNASDLLRTLSHRAVDRYLYDNHFGARLLAASRPVWQLLSQQARDQLHLLQQRLNRAQPPRRWPARLQAERFAKAQTYASISTLDQMNLWSLFAVRSIIATHLTIKQNEPRSRI
jgi:hypothetical protein